LAVGVQQEEIPGTRDTAHVSRTEPAAAEDALVLGREDLRRNEVFACQSLRAGQESLFGLEERNHGNLRIKRGQKGILRTHQRAGDLSTTLAAFRPAAPLTPPPPCTPEPHRYKPSMGVLWLDQPGTGRMNSIWSNIS